MACPGGIIRVTIGVGGNVERRGEPSGMCLACRPRLSELVNSASVRPEIGLRNFQRAEPRFDPHWITEQFEDV